MYQCCCVCHGEKVDFARYGSSCGNILYTIRDSIVFLVNIIGSGAPASQILPQILDHVYRYRSSSEYLKPRGSPRSWYSGRLGKP